jgi:hypothetical protein
VKPGNAELEMEALPLLAYLQHHPTGAEIAPSGNPG